MSIPRCLTLFLWSQQTFFPSSDLHSLKSQQPTAGQVRSSNTTTPRDLNFLHIVISIRQIRFDFLDPRALAQIHADLSLFIFRVEDHDHVRAVFIDVSGAEEVAVGDADAEGVRANVTGEVREGPCTLGDFVFAVLDFDQLFVFVVVCVAVLDDEPPVSFDKSLVLYIR